MLAEQCQVPKLTEAADLSGSTKESSEPVEYKLSEELCRDGTEPETCCNGHAEMLEHYSPGNGFSESDGSVDNGDVSGLSQLCDGCAQHCECFQPCTFSEHCVKCSPCCEHGVEHLHVFQQCNPPDQQFQSFDFEPVKPGMDCDGFEHCEMTDFIPESTDYLDLDEREPPEEQAEGSDSEPDTSAEDSTFDLSDSVDSLDCGAELCDEIHNQIESTDDDDDEEEENEMGLSDEESCEDVNPSCCETPVCCDEHESADEQQAASSVVSTEQLDDSETNQEFEPTRPDPASDKTSGICTEEDGSSDCSSLETKSFKTCPDGDIPSETGSDSSGESEKEVQEYSSDDQTQWESFEEDEPIEEITPKDSDADIKKTDTVDVVIEDYFAFFDSSDYSGHPFSQKRRYISCFDGGDIDDCLHREDVQKVEEAVCPSEKTGEITTEEDESLRGDSEENPEDWSTYSESSVAEEDSEDAECESHGENNDEAEEEEEVFDGVSLSSGGEESMSAPCAEDISVEGDAYEDELSDAQTDGSFSDNSSVSDICGRKDDEAFTECSEVEPYWFFTGGDDYGELWTDVEEYYTCQIKSLQSSGKQALNDFILGRSYGQEFNGNVFRNDEDLELQIADVCPEKCETVGLYGTGLAKILACSVDEQAPKSGEASGKTRPPSDIIHSVVSEHGDSASEENEAQTRDSDEEQSDDESSEACDCEYCIPLTEQV